MNKYAAATALAIALITMLAFTVPASLKQHRTAIGGFGQRLFGLERHA
jgi:hypothetical protein